MLILQNISYHIGARTIYNSAFLHIKPQDHLGLIGPNGAGKSTLLKIITGGITPSSGTVTRRKECTIGFLDQDLLSYQTDDSIRIVAMQAFEQAIDVQRRMDQLFKKIEHDHNEELLDQLANLQAQFEQLDGYTLQSKVDTVLEGIGFLTKDLDRPLSSFSGGWRMRVMLAKLLLQQPALLLLDEPTNHLDIESIAWVESYLQNYPGAFILVSHDRQFLNQVTNKTAELDNQKLTLYSGNYEYYEHEKALRAELQQNAYNNQQKQIQQTEQFINRFRYKATKARQVQSKIKALCRIEKISAPEGSASTIKFKFPVDKTPGKTVASLVDIKKSFGELKLLDGASIQIFRGDKIALIGANGKGKSTLLRIIAGTEPIQNGLVQLGYNVVPSFYAQHQLEALNGQNTVLDELKQVDTDRTETELRSMLGMFLFTKDDVFKKIQVLSGGERARVALAKTLLSKANFLLLDEPTNHLDMASIDILTQALQQYSGTLVLVSHDRHFISQTADITWKIQDQQILVVE